MYQVIKRKKQLIKLYTQLLSLVKTCTKTLMYSRTEISHSLMCSVQLYTLVGSSSASVSNVSKF